MCISSCFALTFSIESELYGVNEKFRVKDFVFDADFVIIYFEHGDGIVDIL